VRGHLRLAFPFTCLAIFIGAFLGRGILHLLYAASIGAGSLLFAWLVSLVTEAKTDVARAQLNHLFGERQL
jgi:hypothetical protein